MCRGTLFLRVLLRYRKFLGSPYNVKMLRKDAHAFAVE